MILDLHRQGLSLSAIARQTGLDRKTVRRYIKRGLEPPAYRPRPPRAGAAAPRRGGRAAAPPIARYRAYLFVFVTDRAVPATANVTDRALHPSVIFRKVTNGFRSGWGAQTYAAFRSVVSTAKANRRSVLDSLHVALAAPPANQAVELPG